MFNVHTHKKNWIKCDEWSEKKTHTRGEDDVEISDSMVQFSSEMFHRLKFRPAQQGKRHHKQ